MRSALLLPGMSRRRSAPPADLAHVLSFRNVGGAIVDASSYGRTLTPAAGAAVDAGVTIEGLPTVYFDGSSAARVAMATAAELDPGAENWVFDCTFRPDNAAGASFTLYGYYDNIGGDNNREMHFGRDPGTGRALAQLSWLGGTTNINAVGATGAIVNETTHRLVVERAGDVLTMSLDTMTVPGVWDGLTLVRTMTGLGANSIWSSGNGKLIGQPATDAAGGFKGWISKLDFWNEGIAA